jgi:hypothetical protein
VPDPPPVVPRVGTIRSVAEARIVGTAALISDTAVPAWHEGHPELPFVFTGSAAMAAGGLGLLAAPVEQAAPARNLALLGVAMEAAA